MILSLNFHDLGFQFRVLDFRVSGFRPYRLTMFVILESQKLKPIGFEHAQGYAGLAAGKLKGCS